MTQSSITRCATAWFAVCLFPAALFAEGEKRNILAPDTMNSISTLIVFGLLLLILRLFAWKPILEGLQKREEKIRRAREDADMDREEARKIRDELRAERNRALDEAKAILDAARRDAERLREEERTRTAADLQADRERMRNEIEAAKTQALQEIWTQAVHIATRVTTSALAGALPEDTQRQLVDRAITDLRSSSELGGNGAVRA